MDFNELLKLTLEKQALDKARGGRGRGRPRGGTGRTQSGPSGVPKISGRGINLAMLMRDGLINPGKGVLKMDYFGNTFEADLMEDGQLQWSDTNLVFSSPSAWASHCKQLVNPEKKSGCGWTTVKYNGRKLEWYKTKWMRNQRMKMSNRKEGGGLTADDFTDTAEDSEGESHTSQEGSEPAGPSISPSLPATSEEAKPSSEPERPHSAPSQGQRPNSGVRSGTYSPSQRALLEKAGIDGLSLDIASLAAIFGAGNGGEAGAFEKNILEKALSEQAAVEAALAGQLQQKQQHQLDKQQQDEIRKQEEIVRNHQKLQEEYMQQQEELLWREHQNKEKQKKEQEKVLAEQSQALQQGVLGNAVLQQNFIQNAIINQAVLEKAIKDHAASGQTDKVKQMLLEEAMRQQATIIQAAMAQIAEAQQQKDPEVMKEAQQDASPAESSLIDCVKFSVVQQKQPYSVYISSNSLLLMDYHCHLSTDEVYGYLGGRWDPNSLTLHVTQVFPCSLHNPSDSTECSLIQNKIRELIVQQDLTVIGWYHSHPTSSPRPSQHDIVCQSVHQQHMRSLDGRIDPCLGVIVSPFRGKTPDSEIQAFCVMHTNEGTPVPMHLEYTCLWDNAVSPELATEMRAMSQLYAKQESGVKFEQHWRNNISIFSKMTQSLKLKCPKDFRDDKMVDVMRQIVAKED